MPSLPRGTFAVALVATAVISSTGGAAVAAKMITGADIKNGTITTADVKDKTLTSKDLSPRTVTQLKGARGPAGASGVSGYEIVQESVVVTAGDPASVSAICPAGKVVVGGNGFWLNSSTTPIVFDLSAPDGQVGGTTISGPIGADDTLVVNAVCIKALGTGRPAPVDRLSIR